MAQGIPEALRAGRRVLDGLDRVKILKDWTWNECTGRWALLLQLRSEAGPSELVPDYTNWFVTADSGYPGGEIEFFPAKEGGLTATFPHQLHNGIGGPNVPWRAGKICVAEPLSLESEGAPYLSRDLEVRLYGHCLRALDWLDCAARGELQLEGDPFELPDFPSRASEKVVFLEGAQSFGLWTDTPVRWGRVKLVRTDANTGVVAVQGFEDHRGRNLMIPEWGAGMAGDEFDGLWLRVAGIPVVTPWGAPTLWSELLESHPQLAGHLADCVEHVGTTGRWPLLVGFPIPELIGGAPNRMHWQAAMMPPVEPVPKGFRRSPRGRWNHYRGIVLGREPTITWCRAENWGGGMLSSRGQLPDNLRDNTVLLLGAGALGSAVAEMLVRGGVTRMMVMDGDVFAAGNLLRHTLTLRDLERPKASALADHLNQCSATAQVRGFDEPFPPKTTDSVQAVRECDTVVDCTGEDETIVAMEVYEWGGDRLFASFSFGFHAQRLYSFMARDSQFPGARFRELHHPWGLREGNEMQAEGCRLEGIGCWHRVFPARWDEVTLAASLAVADLADRAIDGGADHRFTVYQHTEEDAGGAVFRRIRL